MRLSVAGAVFIACAMVATAVGIVASDALATGFARLTGDKASAAGALFGRAAAVRE